MREFKTAVESVIQDDETEAKIAALIAEGKTREEAEAEVEPFVEFKMDERVMRAYMPHEGQLTFMLAAMGRGQTSDQRFGAIINIMMEALRSEDQDYLEDRMLTRDRKRRLRLPQIEEIFEYLIEEWFGNPTQSQSDSADTSPGTSPN